MIRVTRAFAGTWCLVATVALTAVNAVYATTYEVGSGQTFPTIQSCLNAVGAGDICNVHTGTYTEQLSLPVSGTLANRITVQNNDSDVVTVQNTSSPVLNINSKSYWTFSGINFTYNGNGVNPKVINQNYSGRVPFTSNYITIKGGKITLASGTGSGFGLYLANSSNLTITNNVIAITATTGSHDGADILYTDTLEFSGNTVYGNASPSTGRLEDGLVTQGTNINIENNIFRDGWSYDSHPDAIVVQGGGNGSSGVDTATSNVRVHRNTVYNFTQGVYFDCIVSPISGNNWIVNNVIYEKGYSYGGVTSAMNGIVLDGEQLSGSAGYTINVLIYNNILNANQLHLYSLRQVAGSSILIKNNIFVDPPYGAVNLSSNGGVILDYNYYSEGDKSPIKWGSTIYALTNFKSAIGQETHSIAGTANLNADYTQNSSSDSRSRGLNLSDIFTVDKAGQSRSLGVTAWDMGAYTSTSLSSTNPPPAPPTGLRVF